MKGHTKTGVTLDIKFTYQCIGIISNVIVIFGIKNHQ